jgi:manganese-dependent inorganic pyrophosphatase
VEIVPSIAGCLLAGLVSDTLNLTSPTTTARDAEILARLEKLANVDATAFTEKLFHSGSVLTSRTAAQAVTADCKEYSEGHFRFSVAQIEELGFDTFWRRRQELAGALEAHRAANDYFLSALFVTDVVQQVSLLLVAGDARVRGAVDYPEREPGVFELAGVVSRKKQLLPYLTQLLKTLN